MRWSQRCFALQAPPRGPARLALLNLGIKGLLEVRLDTSNRAVELPADAAEVGEDGRPGPGRHLSGGWVSGNQAQLAQLAVLGVLVRFEFLLFCLLAVHDMSPWDSRILKSPVTVPFQGPPGRLIINETQRF